MAKPTTRVTPEIKPYHVGMALLMVNQYKGRHGSLSTEVDCDNMKELLQKFGYVVCSKINRNKDEILTCCESLAEYEYPDNCKRLIVYFSGHGDAENSEDCLLVEDANPAKSEMVPVPVHHIISSVALPKNDSMVKMFFIDACRGGNEESKNALSPGSLSRSTCTRKGTSVHIKAENVLLAYSCPPTFASHMDDDSQRGGSQWTNCLIDAFNESEREDSLFTVLTNANKLLSKRGKGNNLQTSEFTSTLTEAVHFKIEEEAYKEAEEKYKDEATHRYEKSWSTLSTDEVVDKVKGILYGHAIGDTIGQAAKSMDKAKVDKAKVKEHIQHQRWGDATDQMLLIMDGVVEHKGRVLKTDFAKRLRDWKNNGLPELGNKSSIEIDSYHKNVVDRQDFLVKPHRASKTVWELHGCYVADNRAVMRTAVLGVVDFNDVDWVHENTTEISRTSCPDTRCTASCIAITHAIQLMLSGRCSPLDPHLITDCAKVASRYLEKDDYKELLKEFLEKSSFDSLPLDDYAEFTYKTMGVGFCALRNDKGFTENIMDLVDTKEANRNCAVAGALMGCKFGFRKLPGDLMEFRDRKVFDRKVKEFLNTLGLD